MRFQTKKLNSGLVKIWIIAIIIILAVVIGGEIYLWQKTSTEKEPSMEGEAGPAEESQEFVVDCGHAGPESSEEEVNVMENCIKEKFKECKPAKITFTIDLGPLGGETSYYYEIIGPIDNLCEVKSKFLKNINPDWVGKEMICQYDNSKDFETAAQDAMENMSMSKCRGDLYELMITVPIEAKKGEKFTALALEKPEEGSGYEWKMDYDSDYVQFIGEPKGIKSTTHIMYEFLALKIGKTKIKFSLQSKSGEIIEEAISEVIIK